MSLIKCPECGKEVSDQASSCPNCGCPLKEEQKIETKEKKNIKKIGLLNMFKKHKGKTILLILLILIPIYDILGIIRGEFALRFSELTLWISVLVPAVIIIKDFQNEQKGLEKIKKKSKIIMIIICVILFVGSISYDAYLADQYEQEQQAEQQAEEKYISDMKSAVSTMRSDADDANELCELTIKVWQNSIYKESSSETDKYTKKNGTFLSDFNDALGNVFSDKISEYRELNSSMEKLSDEMGEFRNPPEQYEDCYKEFTSTFAAYKSLVNLTINYSGSYNSVSADMREKESAFEEAYNKLTALLPSDDE